jgi:predicted RNase H-like nuclease (RuvC/YqgF family)
MNTSELTRRVEEMLREKNEEIAALRKKVYDQSMEIAQLKAALNFARLGFNRKIEEVTR